MANIAVICDREFFQPFDQRVWKGARTLKKMGHKVEVITPHHKKDIKRLNGLTIRCVAKNKIPGITALKIVHRALTGNYDIFHCHELDPLLYGIIIRQLTRKKIIWDCHEDYVSLIGTSIKHEGGIIEKKDVKTLVYILIRLGISNATAIITVTPPLVKQYRKYKPTIIVPNFPNRKLFNTERKSSDIEKLYRGRKVVVYQGGIKAGRGMAALLSAMELVINEVPELLFVIIGGEIDKSGWNKKIKKFLEEYRNNILTTGWIEHTDVAPYLVHADLGLVMNRPTHYNNIIGLPNKLFEYIACGLPVVSSDVPQIKKILDETKCGIVVNPDNNQEIAMAILSVIKPTKGTHTHRKNALRCSNIFVWEKNEEAIKKLYQRILGTEKIA